MKHFSLEPAVKNKGKVQCQQNKTPPNKIPSNHNNISVSRVPGLVSETGQFAYESSRPIKAPNPQDISSLARIFFTLPNVK